MSYLAYHFTVEPPQPGSEILIAMIADMGFESFDYSDTGFTAYIKENEAEKPQLSGLQFDDFTFTWSIEKIGDANWNAEWEKNFEPVYVNDLLCIRAPFHKKAEGVKHEIVIMPKMSFGTGHHQTTRQMCLKMFSLSLEGKRVLDMGTGTGILAILAKMLGAAEVLGIDIDDWSVENAVENCASNGLAGIEIRKGDVEMLIAEHPFDVILANINKNILRSHMPVYAQKLVPNGLLLLSGFFTTDVSELRRLAEDCGLRFISVANEAEWAVLAMEK